MDNESPKPSPPAPAPRARVSVHLRVPVATYSRITKLRATTALGGEMVSLAKVMQLVHDRGLDALERETAA